MTAPLPPPTPPGNNPPGNTDTDATLTGSTVPGHPTPSYTATGHSPLGQPTRLGKPVGTPSPTAPSALAKAPLLIAGVALVVAIVAMGTALFAIGRSADAGRRADAASAGTLADPGVRDAGTSRTQAPAVGLSKPATVGTPTPAASPLDVLDPQATYRQHYTDQVLSPQSTSTSVNIDLDEPRVASTNDKSDIFLTLGYSTTVPHFTLGDEVAGAYGDGTTLQPKDCVELIRTSPLPYRSQVPTQRGTVLCLATSLTDAQKQGIKQRMVVLRVTDLSSTGKVTMSLTAWEVPDA